MSKNIKECSRILLLIVYFLARGNNRPNTHPQTREGTLKNAKECSRRIRKIIALHTDTEHCRMI